MPDPTLSQEIETFDRLLPSIRQTYGSAWAVIVGGDLAGGFTDFESAARFAVANYPTKNFLIRHTNQAPAQIPFVIVEA